MFHDNLYMIVCNHDLLLHGIKHYQHYCGSCHCHSVTCHSENLAFYLTIPLGLDIQCYVSYDDLNDD